MKRVISKLPWFLVVFALVAGGCAAPKSQMRSSVEEAALASVTSVTGEELPDRVRLNIEGTTSLAYTVFRLSEPLRLIVDLADTDVTDLGDQITVDMGNVSTVSPIQFDEDAGRIGRLEVSLVELWDYETSRADNTIIIDFLKPVTVSEETPTADEMSATVPDSGEPPVEEVEVVELELPSEEEAAGAQTETMGSETVAPAAVVQEDLPPAGFINSVLFEEAGDGLTVEFVADGTVAEYLTMDLSDPARLVIDVQNVAKGFAPSRIPVEMGGVSRIRVGEHYDQNKLRFVLDMEGDQILPYAVESVGSSLVLRLGEGVELAAEMQQVEAAAVEPEPAPESTFAEATVDKPEPEPVPEATMEAAVEPSAGGISDIRYRAEASGGAVLIVSDSPIEYEISQPDASHLLVDLRGVDLPRELVRSQDTRDMDGALQAISSYNPRGGGGARVSMTFAAGTSYEVDQTGGTLTVSLTAPAVDLMSQADQPEPAALTPVPVTPASEPATAPAPAPVKVMAEKMPAPAMKEKGPKYTGERITLDFQNADLQNVLRLIAEVSGLNIITAEGVGGKISMRMQDVPWDQALDIILKTKGLGQVREGNVVRIAPLSVLEGEKLAALKAKEAEIKVEDLVLEIVPISYSKAEDLVGQLSSFLSVRGSVTTDKRTNSLIVKDIEENIEKIKALVAELDIPTPQVRIEARIVIVDEGYVKNLGIQWGATYDDGSTTISGLSGVQPGADGGSFNSLVNMPASNAQTVLGFSFGSVGNFTNLDLRLSALEQTNNGRIISSPSLLVIQNETANIEVNNPFPENRTSTEVSDDGATTTTEVSFPDIWTKLKITPQVTSSDDIFMEVMVEKDSKGAQAIFDDNTFTGVNKHKLETKIILQNHGTAVIGGLFTENEKDGNSSVPFFSKIPVLGWLFKNTNTENSRAELLIFINASVVEG
jgi:type IV pilus assembly protein PilQ